MEIPFTAEGRFQELLLKGRAAITLCDYYQSGPPDTSLDAVWRSKKIIINALERWLLFFWPNLRPRSLEYHSNPHKCKKHWERLVAETIDRRLLQRGNQKRGGLIKNQLRRLLRRVAMLYFRLGRFSLAHSLLRQARTFHLSAPDSRSLQRDLYFAYDMALVEEREDPFKAVDRLEPILHRLEANPASLSRIPELFMFRCKLAALYREIGLTDVGMELARRCMRQFPHWWTPQTCQPSSQFVRH